MQYDLMRPEHAYLLGFLYGDGHLGGGPGQKGRLAVEVHARDRELLERLQPLLPHSTLSQRTRRTNFSRGDYVTAVLSCSRLEVRLALKEVGMPEGAKSATLLPPSGPVSLRDFARGLCDADGSLGMTATGRPFVSLVTNSPAMASWWCGEVLRPVGVIRSCNPNARDGAFNIMATCEGAVSLAGLLYQPGDLALERKRASSAVVTAWVRPDDFPKAPPRKRWTPEEDIVVMSGRSLVDIAGVLGRSVQSVNLRRWRLRSRA